MRILLLLLLFFTIIACWSNQAFQQRFDFNKISLTSFYYSDSMLVRDFHISYYVECDGNGKCKIAKENLQGKQTYFQADLPLSFDNLIQKIQLANLDSVYEPDLSFGNIYCGFPLCFTLEDKQKRIKYVRIIPYHIDPLIINFVKLFEAFVKDAAIKSIDTVDLNPISSFIQTTFIDTSRLPIIRNDIKFTPPDFN